LPHFSDVDHHHYHIVVNSFNKMVRLETDDDTGRDEVELTDLPGTVDYKVASKSSSPSSSSSSLGRKKLFRADNGSPPSPYDGIYKAKKFDSDQFREKTSTNNTEQRQPPKPPEEEEAPVKSVPFLSLVS
jgi:hypothetical protein